MGHTAVICANGEKMGSLLALKGDAVVLTTFKASEDGGYILRFFNNTAYTAITQCRIPHLNQTQRLRFGPYEVRTFRLTEQGLESCAQMQI